MGGERETKVASKKKGDAGEIRTGELRVHESGGYAHFHMDNDANKLKCAVPIGQWAKAWDYLRIPQGENKRSWSYPDPTNNTFLKIEVRLDENQGNAPLLEVYAEITPLNQGDAYKAFEKFTRG